VFRQNIWFLVMAPIAALILFISALAELGRTPFDLLEAESEIVAGFHIEYTGMKFGLFYAGELLHALTLSAVIATLFLGGWRGPGVSQVPVLGVFYLFIKAFTVYFIIMWVRYSFPRIRIDHMLALSWKFLTPLALVLLSVTAIADKILAGESFFNMEKFSPGYVLGMFIINLIVGWATVVILRTYARIERQRVGDTQLTASPDLVEIPKAG